MKPDPIKAKIQELCPDVMELHLGTEVEYPTSHISRGIGIYLYSSFDVINQMQIFWVLNERHGMMEKIETGSEYKILGSPITLAVVLRAIQKLKLDYAVMIDQEGGFVTALAGQPPRLFTVLKGWNLEQDNYDQQSEECKQFISSLLGVV